MVHLFKVFSQWVQFSFGFQINTESLFTLFAVKINCYSSNQVRIDSLASHFEDTLSSVFIPIALCDILLTIVLGEGDNYCSSLAYQMEFKRDSCQ